MRCTGAPVCEATRHPTRVAAFLLALAFSASAPGCAGVAAVPAVPPPPAPTPDGSVRVRLVFGSAADLDLYVTGPYLETVYFANTPSKIGGSLDADVRCDGAADVRVETITFPDAPPGHYRVGVDFPERCRVTVGRVGYAVAVDGDATFHEITGEIAFGVFDSLVLEFDYAPRP